MIDYLSANLPGIAIGASATTIAAAVAWLMPDIKAFVTEQRRDADPEPVKIFDPNDLPADRPIMPRMKSPFPIEPEDRPQPVTSMQTERTRKGVMAALKYLRGMAVLDAPRDVPIQDLAQQLEVEVTGHLNIIGLVQRILDATDVDDRLNDSMTTIPVRSLASVAAEAQVKRELDAAGLRIFASQKDLEGDIPPEILAAYEGEPVRERAIGLDLGVSNVTGYAAQCLGCKLWIKVEAEDNGNAIAFNMPCPNCSTKTTLHLQEPSE